MHTTYRVNISDELKQEGDGLPSCNPHVDVVILQQTWKFSQMSEKQKHMLVRINLEGGCIVAEGPKVSWKTSTMKELRHKTVFSCTYFCAMSLMWLLVQMVSSRAQDKRAFVWSCVVWGFTEGLLPSSLTYEWVKRLSKHSIVAYTS